MTRLPIDTATLGRIRSELSSREAALRAQAVEALGALGDARGLVDALSSDDAYLRRAAIKGLADRPGGLVTWRIAQTRFDPDEDVRCAVAEALARRRCWLATHALRRMIETDASPNTRFQAMVGLARMDTPRVDEVLRAALARDGDERLQEMAGALLRRRAAQRDRGAASCRGGDTRRH